MWQISVYIRFERDTVRINNYTDSCKNVQGPKYVKDKQLNIW